MGSIEVGVSGPVSKVEIGRGLIRIETDELGSALPR